MSQATLLRAQIYGFLAQAFLYPRENWLEDQTEVARICADLGLPLLWQEASAPEVHDLASLQAEHRRAFGLTGSLFYETEFGLPHEFRQSQEMADIAGFYRAFGFQVGGAARERPDHLAVELEFMYALALKEAHAESIGQPEWVGLCQEAQRKFLQDHLGRWIGYFSLGVARSLTQPGVPQVGEAPYQRLARFAAAFVTADAERLGAPIGSPGELELKPTPFNPDFSCAGCALAEGSPG
jgi:DMSO reductase family type II enzyme chaperone